MRLGDAVTEYQGTRERVRWATTFRLRWLERRGTVRARAGDATERDAIRLAAIRDELAARGQRPQSVYRGLP